MNKLVRRGLVETRKLTHRRYEWGNTQTCVYTPVNDRQNPALAVSHLFLKGVKRLKFGIKEKNYPNTQKKQ